MLQTCVVTCPLVSSMCHDMPAFCLPTCTCVLHVANTYKSRFMLQTCVVTCPLVSDMPAFCLPTCVVTCGKHFICVVTCITATHTNMHNPRHIRIKCYQKIMFNIFFLLLAGTTSPLYCFYHYIIVTPIKILLTLRSSNAQPNPNVFSPFRVTF